MLTAPLIATSLSARTCPVHVVAGSCVNRCWPLTLGSLLPCGRAGTLEEPKFVSSSEAPVCEAAEIAELQASEVGAAEAAAEQAHRALTASATTTAAKATATRVCCPMLCRL